MIKKYLFPVLLMPFLLQPTFANTEAMQGAMVDSIFSDPKVQKELDKRWSQISDVLKSYQERVAAEDRIAYLAAEKWTKVNPNTPKNMLEFLAQSARYSYSNRDTPDAKAIAENVEAGIQVLFMEFTPITTFQGTKITDALTMADTMKEALFTPKSNYKNIKKVFKLPLSDYFEIWNAYPNTIDLLDPEYVKKEYHPVYVGSQYVIFSYSQAQFNALREKYDEAVEAFYKDPLNKVKNNKPIDYWQYANKFVDVDISEVKSFKTFSDKFGQETVNTVRDAVINYATMKTNKLELPPEVEKYLNS